MEHAERQRGPPSDRPPAPPAARSQQAITHVLAFQLDQDRPVAAVRHWDGQRSAPASRARPPHRTAPGSVAGRAGPTAVPHAAPNSSPYRPQRSRQIAANRQLHRQWTVVPIILPKHDANRQILGTARCGAGFQLFLACGPPSASAVPIPKTPSCPFRFATHSMSPR